MTDRSQLSQGRDFGVLSPRTWRLADLGAKAAFLRASLGWGSAPRHMIQADLDRGLLTRLQIEDAGSEGYVMAMFTVWLIAAPPGPAGRWLIERLRQS